MGLAGWLGVILSAGLTVGLFRGRAYPDLPWRTVGAVSAVLGLATLLTLFLPTAIPRPVWGPGGQAGSLCGGLADRYFAGTGASIIASAVCAVGLYIAADGPVSRLVGLLVSLLTALGDRTIRLVTRSWSDRGTGLLDADADATEPTWWQRRRGVQAEAEADDADEDDEEEDGPALRIRRRRPAVVAEEEVEEEEEWEEEVEEEEAELDEDVEAPATTPSAPLVPIRNRQNRRTKQLELDIAPDPTGMYELPPLDLLLPPENLALDEQEA